MAPWLRVDKQLLDIDGVEYIELYDEYTDAQDSRYNRKPSIGFGYKDGRTRTVYFENDNDARGMYESLFQLLMPELAQALAEAQVEQS